MAITLQPDGSSFEATTAGEGNCKPTHTSTQKPKRSGSPRFEVGSHGAVQTCLWTKKALLNEGFCYKHAFYRIQSHRCIQWAPAADFCNLACRFCWRDTSVHAPGWEGAAEDPEQLADDAIAAFKHLLNGFPGNPKIDMQRLNEALDPKHAAISLDGEPTLFPNLPGLLEAFRARNITTFLVTNGTNPEMLETLESKSALPTQMYISCSSYDEQSFKKNQNPLQKGLWQKYLESLEWMRSAKHGRKVIRMTLAKGLNLDSPEKYAEIISLAAPEYVEVKGYSALGKSRLRMGPDFVPSHAEIKAFAESLSKETGYLTSAEHIPSKAVLLCRDKGAEANRIIRIEK